MPDNDNAILVDVFNENMERHPYPVPENRLAMTDLKPAIARVWCYRGGDLVFQDRTNRDGKLNPCGDRYVRHGETPLDAAVKAIEDITGETPDTAEMLCAGAVPDGLRNAYDILFIWMPDKKRWPKFRHDEMTRWFAVDPEAYKKLLDGSQDQIHTCAHTVWPDGADVTSGAAVTACHFENLSPEEYMLIRSTREKLLKVRPRID